MTFHVYRIQRRPIKSTAFSPSRTATASFAQWETDITLQNSKPTRTPYKNLLRPSLYFNGGEE
jgi:hypothetical protein